MMTDINYISWMWVLFVSLLHLFAPYEGLTSGGNLSTTPSAATSNSRIQHVPGRLDTDNSRKAPTEKNKTEYVCGFPGSPENGKPVPSKNYFKLGEQVQYMCDPNYLPFGSRKRECQEDGTWSGQVPVCDSKLDMSNFAVQTSNDPTGRHGEALDLNPSTCTAIHGPTRWWRLNMLKANTVKAIRMSIKTQPYRQAPLNTTAFIIKVEHATGKYQECNSFANINGETIMMLMCPGQGITGQYVHIDEHGRGNYFLLCEVSVYAKKERYKCGKAEVSLNSTVEYNGDEARYRCDPGFHLSGGRHTRYCLSTGDWSGAQPICKKDVTCSSVELAHGRVHYSTPGNRHMVNTIATFSCEDGYRLNGNSKLVCRNHGGWDEDVPTCETVDCGMPDPKFVPLNRTSTTYNSTLAIKCPDGTDRKAHVRCLNNGSWSLPNPCSSITAQEENRGENLVGEPDHGNFPVVLVIMVVLSLLVALLLAIIFILLFRRRKNERKPEGTSQDMPKGDVKAAANETGPKDEAHFNEAVYAQVTPANGVGKACDVSHSQYYQHVVNQGVANDQQVADTPQKKKQIQQQWNPASETVYAVIEKPKRNSVAVNASSESGPKQPAYGRINKRARESKKCGASLRALFHKKRREKALPVPSPNVVALYAQVNLEAKHRLRMRNQQTNCPSEYRNSGLQIDSDLDTEPVQLRELPPIPSDCDSLYSPQARCGPNCLRQEVMYDNDLYSNGDGWSGPEEGEDLVMVDNSLYGSGYRPCRRMAR